MKFQITQSLLSQVSESSTTTNIHTNAYASDSNHTMYDNVNKCKNNREHATNTGKAKIPEPDVLGDMNDLNNPSALQTVNADFRCLSKQQAFPDVNVHFSGPSIPLMPTKVSSAFGHVTTRQSSLDGLSYWKGLKQMAFRTMTVPFPSRPMRNLKWIKLQDTIVGKCNGIFECK